MTRFAILLVATVLLAGCAAAAAPSTPVDRTTGPVCGQIDQLVVHRVDAFPENHPRFSFPEVVTVSDTDRVREVAHAVCSLPEFPPGAMSCPADLGGLVYHLGFDSAPDIEADAGGCQGVRGIDPIGWTARTPGFWRTLAAAMDVPRDALWGHRLN